MTGLRTYTEILNQSAAGNGAWFKLDSRYEKVSNRSIQGNVTTGDTITIQATAKDVKGIDKTWLSSLAASEITTLKAYTADFNDIINGPWAYIRVVKTGTAGTSRVLGMI